MSSLKLWNKKRGKPCPFKRKRAFISLSRLVWGKSLTFCTRTCSCARANGEKIVPSREAQCNTLRNHLNKGYSFQQLLLCGSRKYPYSHNGGNWKFQGGWGGGSKTQEILEESEVERSYWFPDALWFNTGSKILSYPLSRSFTWKMVAWILVFDSPSIWNTVSFLSSKSILEANKVRNVLLQGKWPPLLLTLLQWSHHVDRKALVTSLVCFHIALGSCRVVVNFFLKNEFPYKVEMMLWFHKVENFLFLFISVHLCVILL